MAWKSSSEELWGIRSYGMVCEVNKDLGLEKDWNAISVAEIWRFKAIISAKEGLDWVSNELQQMIRDH